MKNAFNSNGLRREIGLFSATVLVIANMMGTGIFTTSGFILAEVRDPRALLFCWVCGGLFALCGALCYGELGARFPRAGGEYVFLKESFGKPAGFLSGWISLIYIGFTLSFFSLLTVIGLMRIRRADRYNREGYTTWGYPVAPLLFIIGNLWIIIYSIKSRPAAALIGLATIGMGVLAYFFFSADAIRSIPAPWLEIFYKDPTHHGKETGNAIDFSGNMLLGGDDVDGTLMPGARVGRDRGTHRRLLCDSPIRRRRAGQLCGRGDQGAG